MAGLGAGRCSVRLGRGSEARIALREARRRFEALGARPALIESDALLQAADAMCDEIPHGV